MMIVMIIDHYRIGAISARVSHYNGGSKKCPLDQGSESIKHIQSIDLQSTSTLTDISLSAILKKRGHCCASAISINTFVKIVFSSPNIRQLTNLVTFFVLTLLIV